MVENGSVKMKKKITRTETELATRVNPWKSVRKPTSGLNKNVQTAATAKHSFYINCPSNVIQCRTDFTATDRSTWKTSGSYSVYKIDCQTCIRVLVHWIVTIYYGFIQSDALEYPFYSDINDAFPLKCTCTHIQRRSIYFLCNTFGFVLCAQWHWIEIASLIFFLYTFSSLLNCRWKILMRNTFSQIHIKMLNIILTLSTLNFQCNVTNSIPTVQFSREIRDEQSFDALEFNSVQLWHVTANK